MRRDQHEWELDQPVQEVRNHSLRRDTSGLRQSIRDRGIAGPYCLKHTGDALPTVNALHPEPEESEDSSGDDTEVREPVVVGGTDGDWEGDVKVDSDCTGGMVSKELSSQGSGVNVPAQDRRNGIAQCSHKSYQNGVGGRETSCHDACCSRPSCCRHQIREPVPSKGPAGPRLLLWRDWILVCIRPDVGGSD